MPGNQKNYSYFDYLDDNGNHWNVFGETGGPATGVDGHSTDYTQPAWGTNTRKRHVRYAEYQDGTTFRKYRAIIYTPTAFAAISAGDTVTVPIAGVATGATYTLSAKIAEKQPIPKASRHLADT
jgi:hypothetical protein